MCHCYALITVGIASCSLSPQATMSFALNEPTTRPATKMDAIASRFLQQLEFNSGELWQCIIQQQYRFFYRLIGQHGKAHRMALTSYFSIQLAKERETSSAPNIRCAGTKNTPKLVGDVWTRPMELV